MWGNTKSYLNLFAGLMFLGMGQAHADSALLSDGNQLIIPSVSVGEKMYAVQLDLVAESNPLQFQLLSPIYGEVLSAEPSAEFSGTALNINQVAVGNDLYQAGLQLIADNPLSFELQSASVSCSNCALEQGIDGSPSLLSTAFVNQAPIPVQYSCEGDSIFPAITWTPGPEETVSYAVIIDDPDAISVAGFTWVHMNLFNLPATTLTLPEGMQTSSLPNGAEFGMNHNGNSTYDGPCPPPGQGEHLYYWRVYALDQNITVPSEPMTRSEFETTYAAHILSSSYLLTGRFQR